MREKIQSVPTIVYPTSDGEPMAETEAHRDVMIDFIQMLKNHYEYDDVCVSGNMFMYYEEGNTKKSVAPDVFVVFGVAKKQRKTYLIWEEGRTPDFVLEVASRKTYTNDIGKKKDLYESVLRVKEYFIYDPLGQIVPSFIGYKLIDGVYQEIEFINDRLFSEVLGLELGEHEGELGLYNPVKSEWLQPLHQAVKTARDLTEKELVARYNAEARAEQEAKARQNAEVFAEQEATARQNAEVRAEQEAKARKDVEDELARTLAELERLRAENK